MSRTRSSTALVALLAAAVLLLASWVVVGRAAGAHPAGGRAAWVGTWASVPTATPATATPHVADQTVREVVHTSLGGEALRLRLTNEFGEAPLHVGEVHVARRAAGTGTDIVPPTDRSVTFGGARSVTVPAGSPMVSDPVRLAVPARGDLVVSIYLPDPTPVTTLHAFSFQDNVIAAGDVAGARTVTPTATVTQWFFLSGVSVRVSTPDARAVVAFGDSITDGAQSSVNADHRWPDLLAGRLSGRPVGVVNLGISGNRLLHDPNPPPGSDAEAFAAFFGVSALRRFDRDVVAQPGARYVVVLLGVNDLGHPGTTAPPSETVTAQEVIDAHRQLIARAHQAGLAAYGATIMPFKDDTFGFYSKENEAKRQAINAWMRTSGEYDAVVDFDATTRDPADPQRLRPEYDSGDHLHPNDAGMAALAATIPLGLFR